MTKKTPFRYAVLCALLMILLSAGRVSFPAQAEFVPASHPLLAQTGEYSASLEPVQGLVQHQTAQDNPQDAQSWQVVRSAIPVSEGDRIRTGTGGLAYLTFFEGVEVIIQENTLVVVSTMLLPDEQNPAFNLSVDVLVGSMVTDIKQVLDAKDRFEVHTPGATSAVRGTRWWTIVTPNGETAFAVERGRVLVIPHHRTQPAVTMAAPPVTQEAQPGGDGAMAAAPAPSPELEPGMAVLTDRYGTVLETLSDVTLPAPQSEMVASVPIPGPACGDGVCGPDETTTCRVDCLAQISLPSCGNQTCEPELGEDLLTCASDCGPWAGDLCGNGTCEPDESDLTCAADCKPGDYFDPIDPALCGNGICDLTESTLNCPSDCRALQPQGEISCGDGACDSGSGESVDSCPADCDPNWNGNTSTPQCGNGICDANAGEDSDSCPADCTGG